MKLGSLCVGRCFKAIGGTSIYKKLWSDKNKYGAILSVVVENVDSGKRMRFSPECDCLQVYALEE